MAAAFAGILVNVTGLRTPLHESPWLQPFVLAPQDQASCWMQLALSTFLSTALVAAAFAVVA